MGLGTIIAIVIGIPAFILIVIPMFIQFWVEGQITETLMKSFGVNPLIAAIISIVSALFFIIVVIKVAGSTFGI